MDDDEVKGSPQAAGGLARAESLTKQQRSAIAKRAASARWKSAKSLPVATYGGDKPLRLGEIELPCYVLQDGRRVLTQRGLQAAVGLSEGGGKGGARKMVLFMGTLASKGIEIHDLIARANAPIRFIPPHGGNPADGYDAMVLADICAVVLEAERMNKLGRSAHIADRCRILQGAFAKVGIYALIDEVTGYQAVRPQDAMQAYLQVILRKDLAAWSKRFPDEFYENIYKLKGWIWPGMSVNRYSIVAHYTRDLIYERIAPGLLKELIAKSPKNAQGQRENKLHQWLSEDVGHPLLAQHLYSIIMFQRLAITSGFGWMRFLRMVDQVHPKKGNTLELPLMEQGDSSSGKPPPS